MSLSRRFNPCVNSTLEDLEELEDFDLTEAPAEPEAEPDREAVWAELGFNLDDPDAEEGAAA